MQERKAPVWLHTVRGLAVDVLFGTDNQVHWGAQIDVPAGNLFLRKPGVTSHAKMLDTAVPAQPTVALAARSAASHGRLRKGTALRVVATRERVMDPGSKCQVQGVILDTDGTPLQVPVRGYLRPTMAAGRLHVTYARHACRHGQPDADGFASVDTPALVVGTGTPAVSKVEHGPLGHAHGDGGADRAGGAAYGMDMRAVNLLRRRVVSQSGSLLGTFEVMDAEDMGYKHMTDDAPAAQTERERRREAATPAAAVKAACRRLRRCMRQARHDRRRASSGPAPVSNVHMSEYTDDISPPTRPPRAARSEARHPAPPSRTAASGVFGVLDALRSAVGDAPAPTGPDADPAIEPRRAPRGRRAPRAHPDPTRLRAGHGRRPLAVARRARRTRATVSPLPVFGCVGRRSGVSAAV